LRNLPGRSLIQYAGAPGSSRSGRGYHRFTVKRRLLLTLTLSIFVLAVAPAVADRTTAVSLSAGTSVTKGNARFDGTLTWVKKSREVYVDGTLDDVCPGDGYAANVAFSISVNEGEFGLVDYFETKGLCKERRMPIKLGMTGGGGKKKITGVKILVWETDADDNVDWTWGDHFENYYFNPGGK